MDLDLSKLRCSREQLHALIKTLGIAPMLEACSRFHTLTLRTQRAFYSSTSSPRSTVRIIIPYLGQEGVSYIGPKSMMQAISKKHTVVELDGRGKPLGWEDDYLTFKKVSCVVMDSAGVLAGLDFLLRLQQDECPPPLQGVVFNGGEILTTDKTSIHVSALSTPINTRPALCGRGAMMTLRALLSMDMPWTLEGYFRPPEPKKNRFDQGAFFFRLSEPSGIQVEITSIPRVRTHDMKKGTEKYWIRAPIDQHAISFSVASSFLQEICSFSKKKAHPMLVLWTKDEELEYETTSNGAMNPSKEGTGRIPIIWGPGTRHPVRITMDPEKVLAVLKKSTDEYAQFIVPAHPDTGFDYYEINPVYLNTNQSHYALISQMLRGVDRDRLQKMQNTRLQDKRLQHQRKANG